MCLIAVVPPRAEREPVTDAWLADVYRRNDDGFGFMWHTRKGGVQTYKAVGKAADFIAAYRQMERHANGFAVHVRMATHGKVVQEMSHPYPVDDKGEVFLMHNGILDCGNDADASKSDTWHYIKDVIAPMYEDMGDAMFKPYMNELIGDAIGNNRFVMIDKHGQFHIINEGQGLTWSNMWLSNTYAWPASLYGVKMYGGSKRAALWDWDDGYSVPRGTGSGRTRGRGLTVIGGTGMDTRTVADDEVEEEEVDNTTLSYSEAYSLALDFRAELARMGYTQASKDLWNWEIAQRYQLDEQGMEDLEAALTWAGARERQPDEITDDNVIEFVREGTVEGVRPDSCPGPAVPTRKTIGDPQDREDEDAEEAEAEAVAAIIDGDEELRHEINAALGEGQGHDRHNQLALLEE